MFALIMFCVGAGLYGDRLSDIEIGRYTTITACEAQQLWYEKLAKDYPLKMSFVCARIAEQK